MAKKFKFYLDQKMTVWNRTSFEISAESEEEAKEIAQKFINKEGENIVEWSDDDDVDYIQSEILYDTEENLSVSENNGNATLELYYNGTGPQNLIKDNLNI